MEYQDTTTQQLPLINNDVNPRILVVDDEPMIRQLIGEALARFDYDVDFSATSGNALENLIDYEYSLMLVDSNLPGISGHELLRYCKKNHSSMEIVVISGNTATEDVVNIVKDGAFDFLPKPFSITKLTNTIDAALLHHEEICKKQLENSAIIDVSGIRREPVPGYKTVGVLGTGTMGIVLLVEKDDQQYALKVLRQESHVNMDIHVKRMLREAKALGGINHKNVVRIYESGCPANSNMPYILMEYVKGEPLVDSIKANALSIEQKVYIIAQVASALDAVHRCGIVHRDIKPSNVLLEDGFNVKLVDFGIAQLTHSSLTLTREALGSPAYMSPESFDLQGLQDQRSDIYSLGVVAYELLAGCKPFFGETVSGVINAILNDRPIAPRVLQPDIPESLQTLIGNMLHKEAKDRFQTASDVVQAINMLSTNPNKTVKTRSILRSVIGGRVWK